MKHLLSAAFLGTALLFFSPPSATAALAEAPGAAAERTALAQRILDDPRLTQVRQMGIELLRTGLNAGEGYSEVWIRDFNTFIVPALEANPRPRIREALLVFLHFQAEDGNVPDGYVPADRASVGYKYRLAPTQPQFKAHKNTVETDQESSLVQAVCRYVRVTGDRALLEEEVNGQRVRDRLDRALRYVLKDRWSASHGLLWGATTADWGDVQPEHEWGVELDDSSHRAIDIYDNALFLVALQEAIEVVFAGDSGRAAEWRQVHASVRAAVRQHLWDERRQKFIPHLYLAGSPFPDTLDEHKIYYHGGTAVAIEAGLLTPAEVLVSYGQMLANVRLAGAASIGLTLYPPYPEGTFKNRSMGPWSYQNGGDWTWFGARMVRQLARWGYPAESYRELLPMVERVLRHRGFYEWWSVDNQPRGSGTFRGEAGVLCDAIDELRGWARRTLETAPAESRAPAR